MSIHNGEPGATTYGEALAVLVDNIPGLEEHKRRDLKRTFLSAHGEYIVPQEEVLADEIARLRELKRVQDAETTKASQVSELVALRTALGLDPQTGAPLGDVKQTGPDAPAVVMPATFSGPAVATNAQAQAQLAFIDAQRALAAAQG